MRLEKEGIGGFRGGKVKACQSVLFSFLVLGWSVEGGERGEVQGAHPQDRTLLPSPARPSPTKHPYTASGKAVFCP